jgi:predicted nucleic acid-binding protein
MATLLDTTWLVEHLRGNERIVRRVRELRPGGLAISIVSVAEPYLGVFRSSRPAENELALKRLLSAMPVLDITYEVARNYGVRQAEFLRQGQPMGLTC